MLSLDRAELFHQDFTLNRGLPDILKGKSENVVMKGIPFSELTKGTHTAGVHVRLLTYSKYCEVVRSMAQETNVTAKGSTQQKPKLEVVFGYKGLFFHISKERPQPPLANADFKPKYIIMWIPKD